MKRGLLLAVLFVIAVTNPAFADKRVALVIGNSIYRNVARLENPANDAILMARTLKDLGFVLIGGGAQLDLDKSAMDKAVQAFGRQVQGANVAMFYYAGHGVQVHGSNYLVPVDANPTRPADVDFQMLDLSLVLDQMQNSGTRLNLVILDACRNNPFGGRGLRALAGGLAQIPVPDGTMISYATQPGNVAQDGEGGHSPYTRALAATIKRPGLDLFQAFNEVGLAVKRETGGAQQPWVSSSPINGDFYFAGRGTVTTAGAPDAHAPPQPVGQEASLTESASTPPGGDAVITDCDREAANPSDPQRPKGVSGVLLTQIRIVPALAACNRAMRDHPGVARFVYEAARVAHAQKDYTLARQLYEKAAGLAYAASYVNLGVLSYLGLGGRKDYDAARDWYEKAVAANDPAGLNQIGWLYEHGAGEPKDYAQALQWYQKAIAAGVTVANSNLGRLYLNGEGVQKDVVRARSLFETAATDGDPTGTRLLGYLYDNGIGVAQDLTKARQLYETAAAGGDAVAMNGLGWLYEHGRGVPQDYGEARKWYERSSALGVGFATVNLAHLYQIGGGVPPDLVRARNLYGLAAAAGVPAGMRSLAVFYDRGLGGPVDLVQAVQWYQKAAEAGDTGAMNNLGLLYQQGRGVRKDLVEAVRLFKKGASLGNSNASANIGNLYRDGRGLPKNYGQAREWYEKAAALGNTFAMIQLGELYRRGLGMRRDFTQARKWYQMAAAKGDPLGAKGLALLGRRKRR